MKKQKATKTTKESYELPEIPDYERPVLEKPQEFDFGDHVPRDKTKLDRPATQVRKKLALVIIWKPNRVRCHRGRTE